MFILETYLQLIIIRLQSNTCTFIYNIYIFGDVTMKYYTLFVSACPLCLILTGQLLGWLCVLKHLCVILLKNKCVLPVAARKLKHFIIVRGVEGGGGEGEKRDVCLNNSTNPPNIKLRITVYILFVLCLQTLFERNIQNLAQRQINVQIVCMVGIVGRNVIIAADQSDWASNQ